ncbi:imidazoleglycerol-phosphate dehydratase [Clostridium acetobutylicum]|uniref:Imidazoleglycerol-phosphate dehydratase n=1 Tax=Clostridium acetobutylicum (strain ATCC 824 / DSM 792 / JCM 1419 / IAM 19013 / LMG 5710 / NBRC 13948 / NRRL B-527 / VKM B-1787 / 2291 / W) TaxID=272562 RepID=HIS7_CLOAB|nr:MULTISPECIES: imidazoleglycerol-phosphate dehydratase HisB [Clostridium]Q97KI1.1 RecName: Full=Imidazoleglycerol-phosphate dehydratase; Short=IGPD [Clostridium acetobutylicum ATCC 824]AAK78914.1 Imidazoleglycerol-phosphate dehydratase [Clostridium acetobutylicum ATCC 824]ADZ19989.1 Imidazoleglycerol-phosphate dehydratase [Clostridium acetobutylicum EA 2018]AEI34202.1 imidazoleglycerol-phosphate dehydratase [Clostridium acetobutylicum DSM 1731]AWV80633.1 imidazoleglycerol-phosphate dehydrata
MEEKRTAFIERKTTETSIEVDINLDGEGKYDIDTGIGFFDHMLELMSKHGLIDLKVKVIGDLKVDSHHTVEDTGIVIGECINKALGNKKSINRYGTSFVPMDESLCQVSMDISGRAFLVFDGEFTCEKLGDFQTEMVEEFFRALAFNAGITLHARVIYGKNNHHMIEGLFKAFGRALSEAVSKNTRIKGVMSTKGSI